MNSQEKVQHFVLRSVWDVLLKCAWVGVLVQTARARRAESEDAEDDEGMAQEAQDMLDQINESKEQNNGRIEDQFIIGFFKNKLLSMPCQNQGFILDGFPKTLEQAKELFSSEFLQRHVCMFCFKMLENIF